MLAGDRAEGVTVGTLRGTIARTAKGAAGPQGGWQMDNAGSDGEPRPRTWAEAPSGPPTVPERPTAGEPTPTWRPAAADGADTPDWLTGSAAPTRVGAPTVPVPPTPAPAATASWPTPPGAPPVIPPTPQTQPGWGPPAGPGTPPPASPDRRGPGLLTVFVVALLAALLGAGSALLVTRSQGGERVIERIVEAPLAFEDGNLNIASLLTKAQPSVVSIRTGASPNSGGVYGGAGSGVIISSDGLVLTNAHVIGNSTSAEVTLFDGETREAVLVGSSPEDDVALMAMVDPPEVVPAELGNSADVRVGDTVVAIGNALDLGGTPSVTEGIVSAKDRVIQAQNGLVLENLIQTDAAINPGNSGGPLLNARGEVVGINTAIISDAQNIGFAIAIDAIKPLIDEISAGGGSIRGDQAFLGVSMVSVEDLLGATRDEYGVTVDEGVFVTEIVADSAAENAGISLGDVIISVDGESVRTPADVSTIIRGKSPGDTVTIRIVSGGEEREVTATLGQRNGG